MSREGGGARWGLGDVAAAVPGGTSSCLVTGMSPFGLRRANVFCENHPGTQAERGPVTWEVSEGQQVLIRQSHRAALGLGGLRGGEKGWVRGVGQSC